MNQPVDPPPTDAGTLALQVEALTDMVHGLHDAFGRLEMGQNTAAPVKADPWKWLGGTVAVIGVIITLTTFSQSINASTQSAAASNQKLFDVVETRWNASAPSRPSRPRTSPCSSRR